MDIITIKAPDTSYDIHPLIRDRWSPRSFSSKVVSEEQMMEIFEAARWAASAFNEQPWQYVYALKGTPGFDHLWACLTEGNQPWTKDAAVLVVSIARMNSSFNAKPNRWAEHDLGMANAHVLLQAISRNIYGHCMAGFSAEKAKALLDLPKDHKPVCMMALGYLGNPDDLIEPFKSRETKPRQRKPIGEFIRILH